MKIIAIIPARSGSKSVPNKNIKILNGKPLIAHSIDKVLPIKKINHIIISSDSNKILNSYKIENKRLIFLKRPKKISLDSSPTELTLFHALEFYKNKFFSLPDIILTVEPTSPFRNNMSINKAINIISKNHKLDSVISVVEETSNLGKIKNDKFIFNQKNLLRRRQDRKGVNFKETGVIYATRVRSLFKYRSILGKNIYPLVVSKKESLDINDKIDFKIAEFLSKIYL